MTMWRRQDLRYLPVFHIIIQSPTFYSSVLDGLVTELQFWYWRILDLRHASKKVLSCSGVVVLVDNSQTSSRWYGVEVYRLSINRDRIIWVADYLGRPLPRKENADCGRWNVRVDRILLNPSYCIGLVKPTLSPTRLQLNCSENVDEEAVEQWINKDSTLEYCEVLSDDDFESPVTCGSEEARNFEQCPESDEENLVTHQKLNHGDVLVHTEALLNYLEQEDESTTAEKMILRNLRSIIRRRVNEEQKQTCIISFFTKQ
ncbi:hypothetical protein AVEN_264958-1 [Araneus ventricosus]|uniref:Uncharacterized protein n=1 Tax=Araneus ventricosus TaxID=182803 RepID=A0A4Y2RJ58_ARAVE|nr:hypothetical protein AVEN_264958-1 [Araneus ventricosus]